MNPSKMDVLDFDTCRLDGNGGRHYSGLQDTDQDTDYL